MEATLFFNHLDKPPESDQNHLNLSITKNKKFHLDNLERYRKTWNKESDNSSRSGVVRDQKFPGRNSISFRIRIEDRLLKTCSARFGAVTGRFDFHTVVASHRSERR